MKKINLVMLITLLSCSALMSQNDFYLGVQVGPNMSFLRGNDEAEKNKGNISYALGVSGEYNLSSQFSLVGNISYDRLSVKQKIDYSFLGAEAGDPLFNNQSVEIVSTFQYLDLSVLGRFYVGESFFINAGGFMGTFLGLKQKQDNIKSEGDIDNHFRDFNTGVSFGVGTVVKLQNEDKINFELRVNHGFTNISKIKIIDSGTLKTTSINFIINYSFKLNKSNNSVKTD